MVNLIGKNSKSNRGVAQILPNVEGVLDQPFRARVVIAKALSSRPETDAAHRSDSERQPTEGTALRLRQLTYAGVGVSKPARKDT